MGQEEKNMTMEGSGNARNGLKRMGFVAIAVLLQLILILVVFFRFNQYGWWISAVTGILALILVMAIYGQHKTASIKMPWIMLIMAAPFLGVSLYLMIGLNGSTWRMRRRYEKIDDELFPLLRNNPEARRGLVESDPTGATLSAYLEKYAQAPIYGDTKTEYYPEAALGLEAQLRDLASAKKFIFMEYHAIEDAESFHRIEDVLVEKVKEGVEVRLFYDDIGSIGFINTDFVERMEKKGIRCRVFNPLSPILNVFFNNRDHRKITVIDGRVGFTGGYNIANEYFNLTHPFGYWKDTGIRLEGPAVNSLTVAFLEMWNATEKDGKAGMGRKGRKNDNDVEQYLRPYQPDMREEEELASRGDGAARRRTDLQEGEEVVTSGGFATGVRPELRSVEKVTTKMEAEGIGSSDSMADEGVKSSDSQLAGDMGFVQPYTDNPMDGEHVGENVYISLAEGARNYAWFVTPYLIITDEMIHALGLAAKRGVDVRIITPGIPDKKIIYQVTRSYYNSLARNGVRIFEYTPGFCHCKMSVSDDRVATCGTINMDYRSLYHHFENGCVLYQNEVVKEIRKDFESMMAESLEVTGQYLSGRSSMLRFGQFLLRLAAPLM